VRSVQIRGRWQLDAAAINRNARAIVAQIGLETLAVYRFLQDRLAQPDGCDDPVFQFLFRSFYRLDNAGLTPDFKQAYFALLRVQVPGSTPDVAPLTRALYEFRNLRGRQTLQFSFATKLASTVNPDVPVYDSQVARMYGFVPPFWYETFEDRLTAFCEFHRFLREDYEEIAKSGALAAALDELERVYGELAVSLRQNKKLDFLIWSAGKASRA
jgi:hypothetical protein